MKYGKKERGHYIKGESPKQDLTSAIDQTIQPITLCSGSLVGCGWRQPNPNLCSQTYKVDMPFINMYLAQTFRT